MCTLIVRRNLYSLERRSLLKSHCIKIKHIWTQVSAMMPIIRHWNLTNGKWKFWMGSVMCMLYDVSFLCFLLKHCLRFHCIFSYLSQATFLFLYDVLLDKEYYSLSMSKYEFNLTCSVDCIEGPVPLSRINLQMMITDEGFAVVYTIVHSSFHPCRSGQV